MKKHLITSLSILFFTSVIHSQDIKEQINNMLDQWHLDAAESNFDAYFEKKWFRMVYSLAQMHSKTGQFQSSKSFQNLFSMKKIHGISKLCKEIFTIPLKII